MKLLRDGKKYMKEVIKKTPKERCQYLMKITQHYLRESNFSLVKEYANKGKKLAIKYGLKNFEKDFEDLIKTADE